MFYESFNGFNSSTEMVPTDLIVYSLFFRFFPFHYIHMGHVYSVLTTFYQRGQLVIEVYALLSLLFGQWFMSFLRSYLETKSWA